MAECSGAVGLSMQSGSLLGGTPKKVLPFVPMDACVTLGTVDPHVHVARLRVRDWILLVDTPLLCVLLLSICVCGECHWDLAILLP
jgi:hypothetical protein